MLPDDYKVKVDRELRDLRREKASTEWVKAKCHPIDRSITDLWDAVNKARNHKCPKEEQLRALELIPDIQRDLGSWRFFRNLFIGAFATLLLVAVSAIFAFANVQADTEKNTEEVKEQKKNFASMKEDLNEIKTQGVAKKDIEKIKDSLETLVENQEAATKKKKKRER